jgi:outer membrane protein W
LLPSGPEVGAVRATIIAAVLLLMAVAAGAAEKGDLAIRVSAQWVERTGRTDPLQIENGEILDLQIESGGGPGLALQYFVSDRLSIDVSAAGFRVSEARAIVRSGDAIGIFELGEVDIAVFTGLVRWIVGRSGNLTWDVGAGAAHVIFDDFEEDLPGGGRLGSDTGLVVSTGLDWALGARWGIAADVRYVPFETGAALRGESDRGFGFEPVIVTAGVRYTF